MNSVAQKYMLKRQNGSRKLKVSESFTPPPPISSNHPSNGLLNRQYRYQALKYGSEYKPIPYSPISPLSSRKRKNRKTRKNRKN